MCECERGEEKEREGGWTRIVLVCEREGEGDKERGYIESERMGRRHSGEG
jgi:hypothetical protein